MRKVFPLLISVIVLCTSAHLIGCSTFENAGNEERFSELRDRTDIESIFYSAAFHAAEFDQSAWEQLLIEARDMTPERLRRRITAGAVLEGA